MPEISCHFSKSPIRPWIYRAIALVLAFLLAGCTTSQPTATLKGATATLKGATATQAPPDLGQMFPAANAIPGWEISQEAASYDHDHLFNLVDGQADSFFVYGFESVAVQRYRNPDGVVLNVEIWQVATPADAYGLFSAGRSGSPTAIGNAGDADPGRRLSFWQSRYYVSLSAARPVPDETLQAFAGAITGRLPAGGATPDIVGRLPQGELMQPGPIFFHEELSIQREVWLGGENLLGLSPQTNGVVGKYKVGTTLARLVLIEYPTPEQAAAAWKALQSSGISSLAASEGRGALLGAVFGKLDSGQAGALLQDGLKDRD